MRKLSKAELAEAAERTARILRRTRADALNSAHEASMSREPLPDPEPRRPETFEDLRRKPVSHITEDELFRGYAGLRHTEPEAPEGSSE